MIKQIYTTGQAIQKELNRLYPKEHENFDKVFTEYTQDRICEWFILTKERINFVKPYLCKIGSNTLCERVIKIMELHKIYAVNLLDTSEEKKILLDANIKDLNDYNARNTNFIEVKNYFCYLPERAKELINKHIDEDNCSNYYTEYTYDVGGKYFLNDALDDVENKFADDEFETEEEKAFYTELKAVLEQISCDVIHY